MASFMKQQPFFMNSVDARGAADLISIKLLQTRRHEAVTKTLDFLTQRRKDAEAQSGRIGFEPSPLLLLLTRFRRVGGR